MNDYQAKLESLLQENILCFSFFLYLFLTKQYAYFTLLKLKNNDLKAFCKVYEEMGFMGFQEFKGKESLYVLSYLAETLQKEEASFEPFIRLYDAINDLKEMGANKDIIEELVEFGNLLGERKKNEN